MVRSRPKGWGGYGPDRPSPVSGRLGLSAGGGYGLEVGCASVPYHTPQKVRTLARYVCVLCVCALPACCGNSNAARQGGSDGLKSCEMAVKWCIFECIFEWQPGRSSAGRVSSSVSWLWSHTHWCPSQRPQEVMRVDGSAKPTMPKNPAEYLEFSCRPDVPPAGCNIEISRLAKDQEISAGDVIRRFLMPATHSL